MGNDLAWFFGPSEDQTPQLPPPPGWRDVGGIWVPPGMTLSEHLLISERLLVPVQPTRSEETLAALEAEGGHHCPRCMRPALRVEADEPPAYSPTDPSTWTRAQLVAELEARMGLRAPDTDWGWSAKDLRWHLVDRGTWRIIEVYPDGSWLVEGVDSAVEPTLTGPEGAFARAERAAGLTPGGGE